MNDLVWAIYRQCVGRFGGSQRGATAVEYGLMLALIVTVSFGAMSAFGQENEKMYGAFTLILNAITR
ncbi:MAG: Flp family type IVb pilin [Actinomycetia bacterium]|nr:Flp family type IVb pilin [Actinomycetes bacterium]